jgi:hypothetical protein
LSCRTSGATHRIPFCPVNATGAPELSRLNGQSSIVSSRESRSHRCRSRIGLRRSFAIAGIVGKGNKQKFFEESPTIWAPRRSKTPIGNKQRPGKSVNDYVLELK